VNGAGFQNFRSSNEYLGFCRSLNEIHEEHEKQKIRLSLVLEEIAELRRRLVREFGRAKHLLRRLNSFQKKQLGLLHNPGELKPEYSRQGINVPDLKPSPIPELPQNFSTRKELKAGELKIISMIDTLKKDLLRLKLLEMRFHELIVSINKALDAYIHEWRQIKRSIYPLGVISVFLKSVRRLWGAAHFSAQDIKELAVLGNLAGNITKMAFSPVV
jgi:hypothetical protein